MDISRRNFLKLGAAGTAAAGLAGLTGCAPSAPSAAASSNDLPVTGVEDWLGSAPELSPDDCARTLECDVLVVGSALSGSMAAYGAMRNGAAVTVIERNAAPHIGGMTISFLNSQTQLEAGLPKYDPVETANAMFNLTQYRSDMRLNAVWCERSGEVLDNLRADFLEPYHQYYMPMSLEGIFPEPSQEITAYISTGVAFSETDILTDFTHNIHQFLEDKGVETHYNTKAEVLVQDESGRVTGVIATNENGESVYYKAAKGVIMCTGSFGGNEAMMRRFYPEHFAEWPSPTTPTRPTWETIR